MVVYKTQDFSRWEYLGVVMTIASRPAGIEFRPHVVHNANTGKFVMWFEDRPSAIVSSGYSVATAVSPAGPFATVATKVAMADVPGDFDLLVDDDGACYHVQTTTNDPNATKGFVVTLLDSSYTQAAFPKKAAPFEAPMPAEGPVFFKREGLYYILGGTTCCACRGGSSIYVFVAPSPLGPWRFVSDIGSTPHHQYDPSSRSNYVTGAQASDVVQIGGGQFLWLGNQWYTGATVNSNLMYWTVLDFRGDSPGAKKGAIAQVVYSNATTIVMP